MASVRQATGGDAPVLARMLHDFNTEFGLASPGVAAVEERVRAFLADGSKEFILGCADDGGEPRGFAQLCFFRSVWAERPIAHVDELYVAPGHRGGGIGRVLVEALVARARERGAPSIGLVTGEANAGARGLYESFGFRNDIEVPDDTRALSYELELE